MDLWVMIQRIILPLRALDRTNFDSRPLTPWHMKPIPSSVINSPSPVNRNPATNDERIFFAMSIDCKIRDSCQSVEPASATSGTLDAHHEKTILIRAYKSRSAALRGRRTTIGSLGAARGQPGHASPNN